MMTMTTISKIKLSKLKRLLEKLMLQELLLRLNRLSKSQTLMMIGMT